MKNNKTKLIALLGCLALVVLAVVIAVVVANQNKESGKDKVDDSEKNQLELQYEEVDIVDEEDVVEEEEVNSTGNGNSSNSASEQTGTGTGTTQDSPDELVQPSDGKDIIPSDPDTEPPVDDTQDLDSNVLPLQPLN